MNARQRQAREEQRATRLRDAMKSLIGNTAFEEFIGEVRHQCDAAVFDAINDTVIANERLSAAALGEVRCYKAIISLYDEALVTPEEPAPELTE